MNCIGESDEEKALLKPGEKDRRYSSTDSSTYSSINNEAESSGTISTRLRVYKRRWYILFLFIAMNITQNMFWNTFGPIQGPVELIFHWKDRVILLLSLWAAVSFILVSAPMGWLMETKGTLIILLYSILQFKRLNQFSYLHSL